MSLFDATERRIAESARRLRNRAANVIRRAVIKLVDDAKDQQELQLQVTGGIGAEDDDDDPEVQDAVEHFEHYGLTTSPPEDAEGILLRIGGERLVQAVIATAYRQARPKLADQGDVTLWDLRGHRVELQDDRIVVHLNSEPLELGAGATLGVARETDPVRVDDSTFAGWMSAVDAAIGVMAAQFNGVPGTPIVAIGPGAVVPTSNPGQATGQITDGSSLVRAVD